MVELCLYVSEWLTWWEKNFTLILLGFADLFALKMAQKVGFFASVI